MTARIRNQESHFKAGEKVRLYKSPLLKHLTYKNCCELEVGERVWLPTDDTGVFIAATVTKVTARNAGTEIKYSATSRSGHFTVYPKKSTKCYRFLDEEAVASLEEVETRPQLRVVGED